MKSADPSFGGGFCFVYFEYKDPLVPFVEPELRFSLLQQIHPSSADFKIESATQNRLESLQPPGSGRVEYRDTKTKGLILRVTTRGQKTFYYRRWCDGAAKRVKLGGFPEMSVSSAREAASDVQSKMRAGVDVAEERRAKRSCPTLKQAFDFYIETHAKPKKQTWKEDLAQFDRYLDGPLSRRRLNTIRKPDAAQIHAKIGKNNGIYAANRLRSLLVKVFEVAIDAELFAGPNPIKSVKKFREQSRDRFLDAAELKRFFAALQEEENEVIRDYLTLSLLVGARRSNMLAMRWDDIDLQREVWRIPETKSGEPQIVPLSQAAMKIIEQRRQERKGQCEWVFPSTGNRPSRSGHIQDPTKVVKEILTRANKQNKHTKANAKEPTHPIQQTLFET